MARHLFSCLLFVALLLLQCFSVRAQTGGAVHLRTADIVTVPGGSFDPPGTVPAIDASALSWRNVALPYVMPRSLAPVEQDEVLTTWLRFPVDASITQSKSPYLYLPRWQTIGKIAIYVNGRLVQRSEGGVVWNGYNYPLWVSLSVPDGPAPSEILIRLDHPKSAGAAISTAWIGEREALQNNRVIRQLLQTKVPEISSAAFLLIGVFALGVWLKRRRETIYLLFFLASLISYVRCLHYYVGLEPLIIPEAWFSWLTLNSAGLLVLTVYSFAFRMHGRRYPRLEISLAVLIMIAMLIALPPLSVIPEIASLLPLAYLLVFGVVVLLSVVMCFASWRSRSMEGLMLSFWQLLNIPLIIHDWMLQNYLINIESLYLLPYSVIGTCFIFMALVLRRYLGALNDMEQVNVRLESQLRQREATLAENYEKLRHAERQQVLSDERQRLIRDMHDGLGSSLTSALMAIEHHRVGQLDVAEVLRECIDDLRLTIDSLEPPDADLGLLLASLRYRLGSRIEQAGIVLHWEMDEELRLEWLSPGSALQIMRMLQEIFTNIIKHAQATAIRVAGTNLSETVLISVEDNGKGFTDACASTGRGLVNLKRRAELLQALVQWTSRPGCTRFELILPKQIDAASGNGDASAFHIDRQCMVRHGKGADVAVTSA